MVALNVPWPPDYGGAIDIFHKIRWLNKMGIKVILHAYRYGRPGSAELEKNCEAVHYYPRPSGPEYFFQRLPYIVATRNSQELILNLLKEDYPVLFEGLHTTYPLYQELLRNRVCLVRCHNIEHEYYNQLGQQERVAWKKLYFHTESIKLRSYEKVLDKALHILAISPSDHSYFSRNYQGASLIGPFHGEDELQCTPGMGHFVLYHGDLTVKENSLTALQLIRDIFSRTKAECIIAGKNPPKEIYAAAGKLPNITIIADPGLKEMDELITHAQVHVLPASLVSGIKLKLVHALFKGRHVVTNTGMVQNTGLEGLCEVAEDAEDMLDKVQRLLSVPFTRENIAERNNKMPDWYRNEYNAEQLIQLL